MKEKPANLEFYKQQRKKKSFKNKGVLNAFPDIWKLKEFFTSILHYRKLKGFWRKMIPNEIHINTEEWKTLGVETVSVNIRLIALYIFRKLNLQKKLQVHMTSPFYQTFKKEVISILHNPLQKIEEGRRLCN